jgi:hypothetical protein
MGITSNKLFIEKNKQLGTNYSIANIRTDDEILLLTAPKETDEIARKLGISSRTDFVNKTMKDNNSIKQTEKKFKGYQAFKGHFIKTIANKYFLKILTIDNSYRYFSDEALDAIKVFSEKHDKDVVDSGFFMLAETSYFGESDKNKLAKTFIIFYRGKNDSYRTIKKEDTLIQIYSSGNDFSELSRLKKFIDTSAYADGSPPPIIITSVIGLVAILTSILLYLNLYGWSLFMGIISVILFSINITMLRPSKYWTK